MLSQLVALIEKAESNPRASLMVGFSRRFDASYREALSKVRANAIGRPVIIRSQGCEALGTDAFAKQYLQNSGGIFIDTVIHDIDLSIMFFGEDSQPKSVSAAGVAAIHTELEKDKDADNAVGICEYWDGRIAYFYHSRTTVHGYDNPTEIFGTAGKLSVNLVSRQHAVELCDADGYMKTKGHPGWYDRYAWAFVDEANMWVDALLDEKPLPVPLRSSLTSLKIATALQQSLRTGQKVFFTRDGVQKEIGSNL